VDAALDLIEHGDATYLEDPELLALARLAHREDKHVRAQMAVLDSPQSEDMYEALFR
jgi:hypothetical protein